MFRKFRFLLTLSILILLILPIYSEALKIASWNLLNFPGSTGTAHEDDFRKVLEQLKLDILVVQEMSSEAGVNQFLNNVMNYSNPGIFKAAQFYNGPDTDNILFYRDSKIELLSQGQIGTALRDISEYVLRLKTGPASGTVFRIYSLHLKAGDSNDDQSKREAEASILRNYLNNLSQNSLFLVCGDYNMQASNETAF